MLTKQLITICLVGLLGGGAGLPAGAQTGRIAHFSHSGGAATLAAAESGADNFGLWEEYRYTKVTWVNDSMVLAEGQRRWPGQPWKPAKIQQMVDLPASPAKAMAQLRKQFPEATFVGFENMGTDKSKPRRKKAVSVSVGVPHLPGGGLPVFLVLILTGMGWLLANKPRAITTA